MGAQARLRSSPDRAESREGLLGGTRHFLAVLRRQVQNDGITFSNMKGGCLHKRGTAGAASHENLDCLYKLPTLILTVLNRDYSTPYYNPDFGLLL